MRIQDPALGKYSLQVGINKYIIYDGDRSVLQWQTSMKLCVRLQEEL